jgi:hypothetical protein
MKWLLAVLALAGLALVGGAFYAASRPEFWAGVAAWAASAAWAWFKRAKFAPAKPVEPVPRTLEKGKTLAGGKKLASVVPLRK